MPLGRGVVVCKIRTNDLRLVEIVEDELINWHVR